MGFALSALIVLAPTVLRAGGQNVPFHYPENVVLLIEDDRGIGWHPSFDYAGLGETGRPSSLPTMDLLAASGLKVANFHAAAQCSPSYAQLDVGSYRPHNWTTTFVGEYSGHEPSLAREIRRGAPDVSSGFFGKPGWGPYTGYCTTTRAICGLDSDCTTGGDTCDFPAANADVISAGYDTRTGGLMQNEPYTTWDWVQASRLTDSTFSASTTIDHPTYKDDQAALDFATFWAANSGSRRFAVMAIGNPHSGFHQPPGAPACGTDALCYKEQITYASETTWASVLATIGDELAETCVIEFADNGSEAQFVAASRGGKFTVWEGGTQTGAIFSQGCLAESLQGTTHAKNVDLVDVHRLVLAYFGAWDPQTTAPNVPNENRLNGQTRSAFSDDLHGFLAGWCRTSDCYPNVEPWGSYFDHRSVRRALSDDSGYKLVLDFDVAIGTDPQQFYFLPDESTDLCAGDCAANLTAPELVEYEKLLAKLRAIEAEAPTEFTVLSFSSSSGGSPTNGVAFDWKFRVVDGLTYEDENYPTQVVCDVDFDDGAGVVRIVHEFSAQWDETGITDASTSLLHPITYGGAGAITITGTCSDMIDPSNVLTINYSDTVL